LTEQRTFSAR